MEIDKPSCVYDLKDRSAVVTGAAGAIGYGICKALLNANCRVCATDVIRENLDRLVDELKQKFEERITGTLMDVTDENSVRDGIEYAVKTYGRLNIGIINAGMAHVSLLKDMDVSAFRKSEKINVEGTLLVLRALGKYLEKQNTGGDIVLISTKNVFAPGAGFGAYSATKSAAHQLARIASLEFAPMNVRVNMVAPDAVFSEGGIKSGLWQTVGPDRMKARGLDEKGLEEYYRTRNLLKTKITATDVANAVLFFVSRQTPTTGATIPVDGGLPDATPR
ncbi:MAG: SDR family NAD(P)-dependent oxidoreductase [Candidatus Omnitrophica bacterium]|nr:SDR family NAD(P)-dependent oxidoreductase [Candidatus Omnitrophota bacterium]